MTKIDTVGKRFNEVSEFLKPIPTSKMFNGKRYNRHTSSFSEYDQKHMIMRMRKAGIKIRVVKYKRAGRTVYTMYTKSR